MNDERQMPSTVAFYLPQFHPTDENDRWWGPGFTEWHTVAKGRPLFRGHQQPRLPGALGFYDLRLDETVTAQAELAAKHGIDAMCYWHYWFAGRRVLDRPARDQYPSDDLPVQFCLGWANEDWTRVWSGSPRQKLLEQTYPGPDDDRAHFAYAEPMFHSKRYLRVGDKPVFYIYRPHKHPNLAEFIERWRQMAQQSGLPGVYFVGEVDSSARREVPSAGIPALDAVADVSWQRAIGRLGALRKRLPPRPLRLPYERVMSRWAKIADPAALGVIMTGWDNTPRRGRTGWVLSGLTPQLFEQHVMQMMDRAVDSRHPLVFVKSWNEWSEGNILEPDAQQGDAYLEAFARALERLRA